MTIERRFIGAMSGTSLDGLDLIDCSFQSSSQGTQFRIYNFETYAYPDDIRKILLRADHLTPVAYKKAELEYSRWCADKVNLFKNEDINYVIGTHGHSIAHEVNSGFSIQFLDGFVLNALTKSKVVCDFRNADMRIGGQGAPLVPIGDRDLFSEYRSCLNLGGISNLSFDDGKKRKAYDIAPCNLWLNYLSEKLGHKYDRDGEIAAGAKFDEKLNRSLEEFEFYRKEPPKSLDKAEVLEIIKDKTNKVRNYKDALATTTAHIAEKIAGELNSIQQLSDDEEVLCTGGGAYNSYLIEKIRSLSKRKIVLPEQKIIEGKEALIFAYLAFLKIQNKHNVLASYSGADQDVIAGTTFDAYNIS